MTTIQSGINALLVTTLRLHCLIASCNVVMCSAELVTRAVSSTLGQFGFTGQSQVIKSITKHIPEIRPYKNNRLFSNKLLLKRAIGHAALGIIANAAVAYMFGEAPSIYNRVLTYLGPVRISTDLHPALAYATSRFSR